jgi:hypothetical protein
MGNLRSMYRSIELGYLERDGKAVRCRRIGKVSYPKVDPAKKFKLTHRIQRILSAVMGKK